MFSQELAQLSGVLAQTIRYYESIGLLPEPERADNNYRQYTPEAAERLRFIVSARSLGFTLADIGQFLAARDAGTLPCKRVLNSFDQRILDIDRRIADLLALRDTLTRIQRDGADLPDDSSVMNNVSVILLTMKRRDFNVRPLWNCHRRWKCRLYSRLVQLFIREQK